MNSEDRVIVIHTGDQEDRIEAWNEGYETAMAQVTVPDGTEEFAFEWLEELKAEIWQQGFDACRKAAPIIQGKTWRMPDNPYKEA